MQQIPTSVDKQDFVGGGAILRHDINIQIHEDSEHLDDADNDEYGDEYGEHDNE